MGRALAQFGTESIAVRKRVKWYNREAVAETIYEGQPVCYIFDTTANILGWDKANSVEGATTAEGSQNEGKFMIVEKPNDDNLLHFAGVVASGDWCGKSIAATSYEWIEIYIPNGAVVPCRADVDTTSGTTILALEHDSQALTQPLGATQGRSVGIAMETETGLDSTADITLVKLDPGLFLYQELTGTSLIAATAGTSDIVCNRINITSAQTAGRFTALEVKGAVTSTANATGYGLALYAEAGISGAVSGETAGSSFWLNLTGGTQTNEIYAVEVGLYESGANLASCNRISPIVIRSQLDGTNGPNSSHYMMTFICDGTGDHPDAWFACNEAADIAATAQNAAVVSHVIPIHIGTPGSTTTYYIMVSDTA